MKPRQEKKEQDPFRGRTLVEGQNPKADDSPEHDEHHDESRRNLFDPDVARGLKGGGKKK